MFSLRWLLIFSCTLNTVMCDARNVFSFVGKHDKLFFLPGKTFLSQMKNRSLQTLSLQHFFFYFCFFYYSVINTQEKTLRIRLNRCLLPLRASVKNQVWLKLQVKFDSWSFWCYVKKSPMQISPPPYSTTWLKLGCFCFWLMQRAYITSFFQPALNNLTFHCQACRILMPKFFKYLRTPQLEFLKLEILMMLHPFLSSFHWLPIQTRSDWCFWWFTTVNTASLNPQLLPHLVH